jgi:cation transport ATPase
VRYLAEQVGITEVYAQKSPEDKLAICVSWAGYTGPSEALKEWRAAPIAHNRVFTTGSLFLRYGCWRSAQGLRTAFLSDAAKNTRS